MLRITQQPCRLTPRMSCGEKWRGLCSVESARGLPPEPLTEPYVILSHHTALVIEPWRQEYRRHQWLSLARWILSHRDCRSAQGPMTWPLRSTAITAASSLSGRRRRPAGLASVRRSNRAYGFPVHGFHRGCRGRSKEGTRAISFTSPYSP
jgi:hypothetical protein